MSKIKYTSLGIGLGLLTAGTTITIGTSASAGDNDGSTRTGGKEISLPRLPHSDIVSDTVKRCARKVYHRFEEIPAISDEEALMYDKSEYTYIINADRYQKSGEIELKRVLTDEISKANILSLIYRSECATYVPSENEDQMAKYIIDFKIINPTGAFKGPSQMDDVAVASFIKYLAVNPATRQNVLPLLKYNKPRHSDAPQTLTDALDSLEQSCYSDSAVMLPLKQRLSVLTDKVYQNIRLNSLAWKNIASPELKKYIAREEAKRHKTLSNTTKNFLCLSELFPDKEQLTKELETYNLTTFPIGRKGTPKEIMATLAQSMDLKNDSGNLDATRIPLFAIAASVSTVNWHGNGLGAVKDAQNFKKIYQKDPDNFLPALTLIAKKWTAGKSRKYGVNELRQMNMITPDIIEQFLSMELPGAAELANRYKEAVEREEIKISPKTQELNLLALTGMKYGNLKS